mmetsp:Transcript_6054/g.10880  ORF Transcript_6054/g.10880 Transcript_6054/m.10880 type:complete len:83 (-) Transcript_6054:326-574(-)
MNRNPLAVGDIGPLSPTITSTDLNPASMNNFLWNSVGMQAPNPAPVPSEPNEVGVHKKLLQPAKTGVRGLSNLFWTPGNSAP